MAADRGMTSEPALAGLFRYSDAAAEPEDKQRIVLVSASAAAGALTCLCWVGLQVGSTLAAATVSMVGALWFAVVFALQYYRRDYLAALMLSLGSTLLITMETILDGNHSAAHLYLLVPALLSLIVFPLRHAATAIASSLFALAGFIYWCAAIEYAAWLHEFANVTSTTALIRDSTLLGLLALTAYQARYICLLTQEALEREQLQIDERIEGFVPSEVACALKRGERHVVKRHGDVTVLVVQLDGFEQLCAEQWPGTIAQLVTDLHDKFDLACREHGMTRIEAGADTYIAVAGIEQSGADHGVSAALVANKIHAVLAYYNARRGGELGVRIGIDSGFVLASTMGRPSISYDLWGVPVERSMKLCRGGRKGSTHISQLTYAHVNDHFSCVPNQAPATSEDSIELRTYWLMGPRERTLTPVHVSRLLETADDS